jgi:hypothetical protein
VALRPVQPAVGLEVVTEEVVVGDGEESVVEVVGVSDV